MSDQTDTFTIAHIAAVLGRDPRELRRSLAGLEPDGHCLVSGNLTRTYLVSSLPEAVRLGLAELAQKRGFDCPERLLARDSERWEHPVSVAEIHPEEITRAQKRAMALAAWAQAYSDGTRPAAEVLDQAQLSHKQTLGFAVSTETIENLFRRVISRDGGRGEFERWTLYLPEMPKGIRNAQAAGDDAGRFEHFESYIADIDPAAPTLENRAWAWTGACDNYQELLEQGGNPRRARRELVTHVFAQAPWLCSSKQSLGKCFDEKWRRYCAGERYIGDGRPDRSGHRRSLPLTKEDKDLLIARALQNGRGLSAAWDNARREGALSPAVQDHFIANPASKSYVPSRIRAELAPEIEALRPMHHGPRQSKLNGAYITRDWSDTSPADWYQADDTTLPIYYWEEDEKGCPHVMRGQFLPMIDLRTNRTLAFALHSERNYTAAVIRGLILRTHDSYGLPRCGFHFENGIWRKAKIITGGSTSGRSIGPLETESGLREWGIKFRHAKPGNARAKKVERIIGLLQDRMEDQPGYCGRDEKTEKFERVQRHKLDVEAGREHPSKHFLHRDEWIERLNTLCELYNDEVQEGALAGKSPRAAWDSLFDYTKPLVKLSADTRWLLANHRAPIKVTQNGITIRASGRDWVFRSEATVRMINRIVHAFYNPEDLSSCFVKLHPSDETAVVVPLAPEIPATTATRDQINAAQASVAAHNRAIHTRYREIAAHFPRNAPSPFRAVIADAGTVEAGREIAEQQEKHRAQEKAQRQQQKQLANYTRRFGSVAGSDSVSPERRLKMNQLLEEASKDEYHP